MKRHFLLVVFLATTLIISTSGSSSAYAQAVQEKSPPTQSSATKSEQVDALVAPFSHGNIPGVAILIIQAGQVVHQKGYGLARLETKGRVSPDTAFDLASVSKQFTAMAVMILADRGKLTYDDPLSKFFPNFPASAQKVTIRNLLTHTSGLVDVIHPRWFKPGYEPTSKDVGKLYEEQFELKFTSGDKFEYNNGAYLLLALIVERVSARPFPLFMRESVFKPLGMNHTLIWNEAKPKVENLALSYSPGDGSFRSVDYVSDRFLYGPKGVISTAADLYKWNDAFETGKLVKSATLRQAFTPMKLNDGTESLYGFGWFVGKDRGLEVVEHPGGYLGYRTIISRYPDQHTTIVVLSNNAQVEAAPLARRIARIYLGDKMIAPVAVQLDADILSAYVGKYKSDSTSMPDLLIEITLELGELYITSPIRPKTKLLAKSPTEFTIGETTSTVTFNKADTGRVTGLTLKTRMGIINAPRVAP